MCTFCSCETSNSKIELCWIGTSRRHGRPCAQLRYEAYHNRFDIQLPGSAFRGVSHYWGLVWVSLKEREIEHATLNEHVSLRTGEDAGRRQLVLRRATMTRVVD